MNQHSGDLRAAILAAVKAPDGMVTAHIKGYTIPQVGRMVQKLHAANLLFRAPMPGKYGRYFDTLPRAEEYANRNRAAAVPGVIVKKSSAWDIAAPMVIPEGLEPEVYEAPPPRFAPDAQDGSWKLFSACRPGEYIAPPSSCAARAAA